MNFNQSTVLERQKGQQREQDLARKLNHNKVLINYGIQNHYFQEERFKN